MTCLQCGTLVPEGSRFCGSCGMLVSDPQLITLIVEGAGGEAELERLRLVFSGEFDVESEIGRGGMGVIYRATELSLRRPIALKVLAPGLGTAPRSTERFRREARVVAELEHPNIVPVYRVGQLGGVQFIAMKLVDGRALDTILRVQGPLTVPVALHVLRAAGRALAYAHSRAIVHRDVKSANFLVDHDGRVLVTDFGVALHAADLTLTEAGAVIGTPAFMSPEQCAGQRAGPQSDQYALGIVAFELLTGAVPFDSDTLAGFIHHHLHTPPPDLRLVRDDIPDRLFRLIERLLAKHPDDRFGTTSAMLDAIEAIPFSEEDRRGSEDTLQALVQGMEVPRVGSRGLPRLSEATTLVVSRPRRRRMRRAALWAAVGIVTGGAAVALASSRLATPETEAAGPAAAPVVATPPVPPPDDGVDSLPPPPSRPATAAPAAVERATLRIHTNPANAQILIDGRVIAVGSAFDRDLSPGTRRVQVMARGYEPFDTTLVVHDGDFVNLGRIELHARGARP